jgi:hypothetical protein
MSAEEKKKEEDTMLSKAKSYISGEQIFVKKR